jgi:hypothetical protein
MAEFDSPWKEVLDRFFPLVLAFLWRKAHADIDWTEDCESLETELRKVLPESEVGLLRVDKLVKVVRKDSGDPAYLHVEVQMFPEDDFERRMYVYNRKAEEVYNSPVVSLAILGDDKADWLPQRYRFQLWGCTKSFQFVSRKLLAWRSKEERLQQDRNPFAVFVLAHLQTLATEEDVERRAEWKERLMLNIVGRKLESEDRREWLRLIDWLMGLPRERNAALWRRIWAQVAHKEESMPFIDYFQEREMEAEKRGEDRGQKLGQKWGLLQGIRGALHVRLPEHEQALLARAEQIDDLEVLGRVLDAALAADLEQLQRLLP